MASIEEKQQWRLDYLLALYALTEGGVSLAGTHRGVLEQSGIPEAELLGVAKWLEDHGFIIIRTFGGLDANVDLTPQGVDEAERLLSAGAATPVAAGVLPDQELRASIEVVVREVRNALEEVSLEPEDEADVIADLDTLNAQLRAARPNREVIRAALRRAYGVLTVAAVTGGVLQGIDVVLRRLGV
jgi:hypothetical protein